jgi:hypothetical protein
MYSRPLPARLPLSAYSSNTSTSGIARASPAATCAASKHGGREGRHAQPDTSALFLPFDEAEHDRIIADWTVR